MSKAQLRPILYESYLNIASLILLIAFLNSLTFHPQDESIDLSKVQEKAEILGYQVAQIYQDNLKNHEDSEVIKRGLSSIEEASEKKLGLISLDPWGQPYHYKISEDGNSHITINIWSQGPPGQLAKEIENKNNSLRQKIGVELSMKIDRQ